MIKETVRTTLVVTTTILILLLIFELTFMTTKPNISKKYSTISNASTYYKNVFDFLKGKQNLSSDFSLKEKEHFYDVKQVLNRIKGIIIIILLLEVFLILFFNDKKNFSKNLFSLLNKSTIIIIFLVILFFLIMLFNFDKTFLLFHKILFPQGNYFFDENSLIIRLFPEKFFMNFFGKVLLNLFLFSLIITLIKLFCCKKQKIFKPK